MPAVLIYLAERFFYRIFEFLYHWYVKSARLYANFVLERLEGLDRHLAWRITFKNLFQPLYKDYSLIGRFLGFTFRSVRLAIGSVVYAVFFLTFIGLYVIWLLIPPYLIYRIFLGV